MKITWSIFPKFYQHLSAAELADLIKHVGLDTTNVVIRNGYWVSEDTMKESLPRFVSTMENAGLKLGFATAGFMPEKVLADDTPLAILADNGIKEFRMGYFRWDRQKTPAQCMEDARAQMESMASLCEKHRIRAVYQVHHGTLIPGAWAAWYLVKDLPSKYVGVMLDPGNQVYEGWEDWMRSAHLLGDKLVAMGIKDAGVHRGDDTDNEKKGWWRTFVSLEEGVSDWYEIARALKSVDFTGTFVYMPFYHSDDSAAMTSTLKGEVSYLRKAFAAVEAEKEKE